MTGGPYANDSTWRKALTQASAWILRTRERGATPADQEGLEAWLAADPLHRKAYENAVRTLEAVKRHGPELRGALDEDAARRRGRRVIVACVMAVVAASLVIVGSQEKYAVEDYATGIGEQRVIALNQATHVTLNTQSRLSTRAEASRSPARLTNGEALFDIGSNPPQLFIVEAEGLRVRADDAQFLLRAEHDSICVLVVRGQIDVSETGLFSWFVPPDESAVIRLVAGQQLVRTGEVNEFAAVADAEVRRRLSWRTGWLEFDGQPLLLAVREMSRYSGTRFEIEDAALQQLPVIARVRTGDLETFLFALETGYPMLAVEHRGDVIRISRRA